MRFALTPRVRALAIGLLSLLAVYAALGFWVVPRVVRTQIEGFSEAHWSRKPALGDISFNPFTFALEIRQFAFRDAREEPMLAFERLLVNLDVSGLWRRGLSFHAIELDRPSGRVLVRADGSLNLAELSAPFAAQPADESASDEPQRLFIERFRLSDGLVEFEDHARASPFKARLTPVDFALLDFSTVAGGGNRYELQAVSSAGERFRWTGDLRLAPLGSRGEFELGAVQARTLWAYLQDSLGFEVSDGLVDVRGAYEFATTEPDVTLRVNLSSVDVAQLKLRPRAGDTDWVSLGKLGVSDARIDLGKRHVDVARIHVADSSLAARRDANGNINLLELLEPPPSQAAEPATPPPVATGEPAWTVNIPEIAIENLRVDATDEFVKPAATFTIEPVSLHLRGFSTSPEKPMALDARLEMQSGGMLSIEGEAVPAAPSFNGRIKLEGLDLTAFQPYIGSYTQMTLLSGQLSSEIEAEYSTDAVSIRGNLDSARLHTIDDALREDFVKWKRLRLDGIEYRAPARGATSLRIASIDARSPYLRLIIAPDQTTNVSRVLTQPSDAPGPVQTVQGVPEPTGAQPLAMSIGKVRVEDGSANFADFWITPNYAVSLQQLTGSISGLSSRKDTRANVALTGKIDRYAPAEISGEMNLLSASLFTDLRVKFDGVELTSVTPYSGRFAGYRIEKGKLSIDVRYLVQDRKLDAQQRFVIDQLVLGERVDSADAVKLPLRLAVALLKDRNGVIDLGLPITGSLDDPQFRIGPIVWKAFVNLLAGVATSPFKLIGSLFGGGEEVNLIDFEPGSADLDPAAREKLAAIAKALHERPQLELDVPATYSPDADYQALAARELESRLAKPATGNGVEGAPAADPARRFELLIAHHEKSRPGVPLPAAAQTLRAVRARDRDAAAIEAANTELEAALRPRIDALQPQLQALAQQRARAIQDALLAGGDVEPARVFLIAPMPAPAAEGKARTTLSLK